MRCSLDWLKQYVQVPVTAQELASRLSLAGLEAKAERRYPDRIEGVVTARILAVEPHPQAEKLTVCAVDTGAGEVRVVCGAPNARIGLLAPLALPQARIAGGRVVEKTRLRGVESFGMLLAEDELGLTPDHSGLMELDPDTPAGLNLHELINFDDHILEVDLTPNRGDCACVLGIAREVAAIFGGSVELPPADYPECTPPAADLASVTILDPDLCPRYGASLLSGLRVQPSPYWLREKVVSGGVRPINNLVDVTNFVLLEMNQPLHAFDFDRLAGRAIRVRRAREGEVFVTLDGQPRNLQQDMLLICDAERPVGLAGVMGGLNSEISPETAGVLIEAAWFDPTSIRRTSTRLGLNTEAAYRFQRGIDPVGLITALKRATKLMVELGGPEAKAHLGLIDAYPRPFEPVRLSLRPRRCQAILGLEVSARRQAEVLNALGIEAEVAPDGDVAAVAPSWRPDLTREIDLIEEVARIHGFDQIPATIPEMHEASNPRPAWVAFQARAGAHLAAAGLREVITYSFIAADAPRRLNFPEEDPRSRQVPLLNPISEDQSALRSSLLFGLLDTLVRNLNQGAEAVRIFEFGVVFHPQIEGVLPREDSRLAGLICGPRDPVSWYGRKERGDFFDLKGLVEDLLAGLALSGPEFVALDRPEFQKGAAAEVRLEGLVLGRLGRLAEPVLRAFDLKEPVFAFDLSGQALMDRLARPKPAFKPLPRFPGIARDLALVVPKGLPAGRILDHVREMDEPLIAETRIFDLYEGKPLAQDHKSIGLRVFYRAPDKTLTDQEIAPLHDRLIGHLLARTEGSLRQ